ncbi:LLM class flavin-dependent oxidoreductase [Nocardioides sp. GXQ0305]|uniref:LLM class flavin-dependent oxidoreductase n=1 Tax=Nocardioides sp. GXQ0305 TaxID=3423912 RepID=UPI003D7D8FE4
MPDHEQELRFGIFPTPEAARLDDLLGLVQLAEVEGLDLVSVQDHPYQAKFVDTWTLLSVLGARTSTLTLAPNVASLPLRPPVVLAKAAATLDLVTGGRVELGLGAGAFWDAIVAAGGPRRTPKEAVDALDEAVQLIKAYWAGGTVRFEGEHYRSVGLHAGPRPAHDIPVWLGAYKPRMLRLTGRLADGWVPSMGYADPPDLPEMSAAVDEAALAAGRSPASIRRVYNVFGRFGTGADFLQGRPHEWAEQLAELTLEVGTSTYVLGTDDPDAVRRWATEVAPAVRELVDAERGRRARGEAPSAEPTAAPEGVPARQALEVRATPAPDAPVAGDVPWDEADRPTHDEPVDASYAPELQAHAQHLVDIHDALRSELAQVRDLLDQVRRGRLTVGVARSAINTTTLRQNSWTLGAYCESYCRIVTGHHTLEDHSLFPHLRRTEPGLRPVLARLEHEHLVIHEVLEEFDRALVRLVTDDGTGPSGEDALDAVQHSVDRLTDTLLSHLAYEEQELIGPLARHGIA